LILFSPFWINYKLLKKKINDIVSAHGGVKVSTIQNCNPSIISKSACEVEFFRALRIELKKASDFFASSEKLYRIRHERVIAGYLKLQEDGKKYDKNTWSRLLRACVKFYKDVLLLENFAIMNYCGFSKILKKHDKLTGFSTREAFMRKVMSKQNFTHYPYLLELLRKSEQLFAEIQGMDRSVPLLVTSVFLPSIIDEYTICEHILIFLY
jgi:SPX domain protein involved in polyphosphate accumulation